MAKTIRIDLLPPDVQEKILALRDKALKTKSTVTVTAKSVEYALKALEEGTLIAANGTWQRSNQSMALGRVALAFFNENAVAKGQFMNFISRLEATGRVTRHESKEQALQSAK